MHYPSRLIPALSLVLCTAGCGAIEAGTASAGDTESTGGSSESSGDSPTTGTGTTGSATMGATSGPTTGDGTTTDGTTGGIDVECLLAGFVNPDTALKLDYGQFNPTIGSHCKGTNHQDITDIERVVFLGDSVTVGTPPTGANEFYRSLLADALVERFGLTPPSAEWKSVSLNDGVSMVQESGDFASCAEWGARTDDFLPPGTQVDDCFPPDLLEKRTLVITTMGGNDIASVAKDGADGVPLDQVMADAEAALQLMRDTVHWFVDDPNKFPNGVFVVYGNIYEFTDGTGDLLSCPAAGLAGFDKPWDDPSALADLMIWINEQYMDIATETRTDMIFMLEAFCGHGYRADDPDSPCYRGPDQSVYFDVTCIHPTPEGHGVLADMFTAVVDE